MVVRLGIVGDRRFLSVVSAQSGDWSATSGGEVKTIEEPLPEPNFAGADVIVFKGDRYPELAAAGVLEVIPDSALKLAPGSRSADSTQAPAQSPGGRLDELPANYRLQVSKFGGERLALPLAGSALVLVYRKDILKRAEAEAPAKSSRDPLPKTWGDLEALAAQLAGRDRDGDGRAEAGIVLPLANDENDSSALDLYLQVCACLGLHRDQFTFLMSPETLEPWVTSPPFVEGFQSLQSLAAHAPRADAAMTAAVARALFRSGRAAMLIDTAEHYFEWNDPKAPHPVGVARLPGVARVYNIDRKTWDAFDELNRPARACGSGGWLVGVARSASPKVKAAALDFAFYLIGDDASARIAADRSHPTVPLRADVIAQGLPAARSAPGVDGVSWSKAVSATVNAETLTLDPRLVGARQYLDLIDQARMRAIAGEPIEKALEAAANAWRELTTKAGKKDRLESYRRGLNTVASKRP